MCKKPAAFRYLKPDLSSPRPPAYFLKINFSIIPPLEPLSSECFFFVSFSHQIPVCTSPLPHRCHITCLSHPLRLNHSNKYIWRRAEIMKQVNIRFPSIVRFFLPLRLKYFPQHPLIEHSLSMSFP